jgi:prepilin peptidase CpaA
MPAPLTAGLLAFIALCMAVDVRSRRIPNLVTGTAALAAASLNTWYAGAGGLAASLGGLGLAIAVLFAPFALGGIGAGDVKMMGAVGAFLGPRQALAALAVGMILGGVVTAVHLARVGRLREKLAATGRMLGAALVGHSLAPLRPVAGDAAAVTLPYSVPLGLGTLVVVALGPAVGR